MTKKKNKNTKKTSKKMIAMVIGVVVLLLVGGVAWAAKYGDGSFNTSSKLISALRNRLIDVDNNKNDGCCLPYCEESGQTECNQMPSSNWTKGSCNNIDECQLGCCQVECLVKEDFPKDSCLQSSGEWKAGVCKIGCCHSDSGSSQVPEKTCIECMEGDWQEGECGAGYYVEMTSTYNTTIGDKPFSQRLDIDLYTCEDTVFSVWRGTEKINSNGKTETIPYYVDLKDGWSGYSNSGALISYEVSVTEAKMTIDLTGGLPAGYHHHLESNIRQGYPACQKEIRD